MFFIFIQWRAHEFVRSVYLVIPQTYVFPILYLILNFVVQSLILFFLQVLGRKGVDVRGQQVTETTLMQTSPIRITQHCAVIDALMTLYLRYLSNFWNIFLRNFYINDEY